MTTTPAATGALFSLEGVGFRYPAGPTVLDGIDLTLHPGERVAVVGRNGAGKTTLLHLLVGLRKATHGRVVAFGMERRQERDFYDVRSRAGLLFQDADDQLFCPTVLEDVAFGPLNLGHSRRQAVAIATATLSSLGLDGFADRVTHKLSGGEKRLVSLAAVLAMRPEVLLLDEPTNGLDAEADARLLDLLLGLPQAMLFISHDSRLISCLATRSVLLREGRLWPALLHAHPHTHTHAHSHLHPTQAPRPVLAGHEHNNDHSGEHGDDHAGDEHPHRDGDT
ncbi:MAG: ABC transporter ATP-binding protein [Rhodospirillales bacterium]